VAIVLPGLLSYKNNFQLLFFGAFVHFLPLKKAWKQQNLDSVMENSIGVILVEIWMLPVRR
jgi:hypothetical protein